MARNHSPVSYINLFSRDDGKTFESIGTSLLPFGENAVDTARNAAGIDESTRITAVGGYAIGSLVFAPPLQTSRAEVFGRALAASMGIEEVRAITVGNGTHDILYTIDARS